ncbi:hypothetical protein ACFLU6_01270 [Acidobacteriota bacterium]
MAPKKLIVVEADEKFGKALQLYFRGSPYMPYVTGDAGEALDMAQRQKPELIVVCLENEKHDMIDMVGKIRENDSTSTIPLILISAKMSKDEIEADSRLQGKFNIYLKKPFVKKAMLKAVEDAFSDSPAPKADESADGAKMPSSDGVDLNQIFSEIDDEIDEFFEKSETGDQGNAPAPTEAREVSTASGEFHRVTDSGEYKDLEGRYKSKVNEVNDLRDKIRAVEREMRAKSDEIRAVSTKGASVHLEKIKVLEKKINDYEEEHQKQTGKFNQLNEMIRSLNEELEQNNRKYKDEMDQSTAANLELRSQQEELNETIESKDRDIQARDAEIEDLKKEIEEQRSAISDGEAQISRLKEDIQQGQNRQQELEAQLISESDRATGLQSDISTMKTQIDGLNNKISEARQSFEAGLNSLSSE